jgi:hypothetical protein
MEEHLKLHKIMNELLDLQFFIDRFRPTEQERKYYIQKLIAIQAELDRLNADLKKKSE